MFKGLEPGQGQAAGQHVVVDSAAQPVVSRDVEVEDLRRRQFTSAFLEYRPTLKDHTMRLSIVRHLCIVRLESAIANVTVVSRPQHLHPWEA
jgi:hypothetical protein